MCFVSVHLGIHDYSCMHARAHLLGVRLSVQHKLNSYHAQAAAGIRTTQLHSKTILPTQYLFACATDDKRNNHLLLSQRKKPRFEE